LARPEGPGPKGQESFSPSLGFTLDELPRRGEAKLRLSRGFTAASPKTREPQLNRRVWLGEEELQNTRTTLIFFENSETKACDANILSQNPFKLAPGSWLLTPDS
jgi:hypothetical protein